MADLKRDRAGRSVVARLLPYTTLIWLVIGVLSGIGGLVFISGERVNDTRLVIGVALAGVAGASVQASIALANFIGNRAYVGAWTAYFLLRPLVGAGVAVVVYVTLRGGLVSVDVPASGLNYYGFLAVGLISGLFSGDVLKRLAVTFDSFFAGQRGIADAVDMHPLDRYHGYLIHELSEISGRDGTLEAEFRDRGLSVGRLLGAIVDAASAPRGPRTFILSVGLQSTPDQTGESTEIDIGEGVPQPRTEFDITVYPEESEVEPAIGQLVVAGDSIEPVATKFVLRCPPGIEPRAFVELAHRGRTVAVVAVHHESQSDSHH